MRAIAQKVKEILAESHETADKAFQVHVPPEPEPVAVPEPVVEVHRPSPPKNADEVDRMIFEFIEKRAHGLRFEKVSPNNYIFGTKKIYAKITNGVLLVRVGGGFMDIESFFKQYAE